MKVRRFLIFGVFFLASIFFAGCKTRNKVPTDAELHRHAQQLAQKYLLIDTHIDVPYRLWHNAADISRRTKEGHFDYPRAVADHIDHVVKLVGINFVGFGSDFDGVRSLPVESEDVSMYPNLIYQLLKRGYSDGDIKKICGENLLRVWSEVEKVAANLQNAE